MKRAKVTDSHWKRLLAVPGSVAMRKDYWVPSEGYAKGEKGANMNVPDVQTEADWQAVKRFLRPVMVSLVDCRKKGEKSIY